MAAIQRWNGERNTLAHTRPGGRERETKKTIEKNENEKENS